MLSPSRTYSRVARVATRAGFQPTSAASCAHSTPEPPNHECARQEFATSSCKPRDRPLKPTSQRPTYMYERSCLAPPPPCLRHLLPTLAAPPLFPCSTPLSSLRGAAETKSMTALPVCTCRYRRVQAESKRIPSMHCVAGTNHYRSMHC